jgi:hypothetical protein
MFLAAFDCSCRVRTVRYQHSVNVKAKKRSVKNTILIPVCETTTTTTTTPHHLSINMHRSFETKTVIMHGVFFLAL